MKSRSSDWSTIAIDSSAATGRPSWSTRRHVELDRLAGADGRLGHADRHSQVALDLDVELGLVELVLPHPRRGEREVGELGAVDRPGDRVVTVLQADELVGEDPVGLPGQQGRAGAVAAVEVDAGLLADLVPLAVGQEPQLGLVLLARDREGTIGDDRIAEPVGPGDAEDVRAPLGVVGAEGRAIPGRSWRRSRAACAMTSRSVTRPAT